MTKYRGFNWGTGLYLIIYHVLLAAVLPLYLWKYTPSWSILAWTLVLFSVVEMGITAGYHRYFAHSAFKASGIIEALLLLSGTMAGQASVFRWAHDHRLHHAHLDTDKDPYSITRGFWHAHMGWLFEKPHPIDERVIADLMRKPLLRFQHKYYNSLMVLTNALAWITVGWLCNDYLGAFVWVWWVRQFAQHHFTWFINSLAHTWGARTFSAELTAVDNFILAFLTFGEGYHNYHHTFANDYRNGIRWYHFDPTKWMVWTLSKMRLTYGLRRVTESRIQKRILLEKKQELIERIQKSFAAGKEALEEKVQSISDQMLTHLNAMQETVEQYRLCRQQRESKQRLKQLKAEIRALRRSLNQDWRQWRMLSQGIYCLGAIPSSG